MFVLLLFLTIVGCTALKTQKTQVFKTGEKGGHIAKLTLYPDSTFHYSLTHAMYYKWSAGFWYEDDGYLVLKSSDSLYSGVLNYTFSDSSDTQRTQIIVYNKDSIKLGHIGLYTEDFNGVIEHSISDSESIEINCEKIKRVWIQVGLISVELSSEQLMQRGTHSYWIALERADGSFYINQCVLDISSKRSVLKELRSNKCFHLSKEIGR